MSPVIVATFSASNSCTAGLRSLATIRAPRALRIMTISRPIPRAAPVTIATLPAKFQLSGVVVMVASHVPGEIGAAGDVFPAIHLLDHRVELLARAAERIGAEQEMQRRVF